MKHFTYKVPFKPVVGFLQIQFNDHVTRRTLLNIKSVNDLLNNDDIIRATTAGKKARLEGADEIIKKRSDAPHKNFGDQFKSGVTKNNWSKLTNRFRVVDFPDEAQVGMIKTSRNQINH